MHIALAQLNYTLNDFKGNLKLITEAISKAGDADLVVFSELALSGYFPQDLIEEPGFMLAQAEALAELVGYTRGITAAVAVGLVTTNPGAGRPFRNSLVVIQNGVIVGTYHKQLLPDYGVFDERRHFEPGPAKPLMVQVGKSRVGFVICEDAWNPDMTAYATDPVAQSMLGNIAALVTINASPSDVGKLAQRQAIIAKQARKHWIPIAYVNQVGGNDSLIFDGGSFFMQPNGSIATQAPLFEESITTAELIDGYWVVSSTLEVVQQPLQDPEFYYNQLVLGIRDYMRKTGFSTAVVGSSGGIDSAVVLALAAAALGPDAVTAVTMPSQYSSTGSVSDSEELCSNLGVKLYTHPIKTLFSDFGGGFSAAFNVAPTGLTNENVQARIRGVILMEFSNQFGALLLTTGNKSEMSVGYSTLYGDMAGGLNPLGDLYKMEVYALASYINAKAGRDIIPVSIITKAPSAELAPGQTDEASLMPYPILDEILKWHIEGQHLRESEWITATSVVSKLESEGQHADIARILALVSKAEFKRRQAAPILRVRPRAFGSGRQIPIARR